MHEVKLKYRAVTSFDAGLVYAPYTPLDIAKEILSVQPMFGPCAELSTLTRRCTHHKKTCPPYGFKVSRCTCHLDDKEPKKYKPIDLATLRGLP